MDETIRIFNVLFQISATIFIGIILVSLLLTGKNKTKLENLYFGIATGSSLKMMMDALAYFFRGKEGLIASIGVRVTNGIEFLTIGFMSIVFTLYVINYIENKKKEKLKLIYGHLAYGLGTLSIVMVVINFAYPFIYKIGEDNLYERMDMYACIVIPSAMLLLLTLFLIMSNWKKLKKWERISFLIYIIAPVFGVVGTAVTYGIVYDQIGATVAIVILFIYLQIEQNNYMIQQTEKMTQLKIDILMSQIQPHFLYNTLGTISTLCLENPKLASETTDNFAIYLRTSLNSVEQRKAIPFEKELEHIKTYLSIEKLRYGEGFHVDYDIQTTDFLVPTLSIQPLVENAIIHGMMGTENVCNILVATKEINEQKVQVTIMDNGIGFNTKEKKEDGRSHIGLSNVESRLEMMVGGVMNVESIEGVGTKVIIVVPQKG